ncbi:MAG: hypothetical protein V4443_02600 [Pseudomonadota bacterium]
MSQINYRKDEAYFTMKDSGNNKLDRHGHEIAQPARPPSWSAAGGAHRWLLSAAFGKLILGVIGIWGIFLSLSDYVAPN